MKFSSYALAALLSLMPPAHSSAFFPLQGKVAQRFGRRSAETMPADVLLLVRLSSLPRRDFFVAGATAVAAGSNAAHAASDGTVVYQPIADLPMIRIKLPNGGFGREYVAIQLKIDGEGPFTFMLDTGLTTEFITPHLQQALGIVPPRGGSKIRGLAAGGEGATSALVELVGASLCCGKITGVDGSSAENEFPLPALHAIITDFPQEHIDPAHDPVEGMLGMEMLSLFDVDFDFPKGRVRFWKPGTAVDSADGLVEIPAVVINETGLIGFLVASLKSQQPVLGFVDCGSSFSAVNWLAASFLGLPPQGDAAYEKAATILAMGIDGRPMQLPLGSLALTFVGDSRIDPTSGRPVGFAMPPDEWKPWSTVQLAIGDLPAFETVLGDGITPYKGPAALIGLDVLAQRRVIVETGLDASRRRRIFVSPK
jgi:hypothetical protein